jgi:hypothetical protein
MSDLRNILKEEYKKKEEVVVTPQSLIEMIEQLYDTVGLEVISEADRTAAAATTPGETQAVEIALPFVQLSEAWGKPGSSQRTDIAKFVERVGGAPSGGSVATLRNRLAQLQRFISTTLEGKGEKQPISQVISNILLLDTLAAIVTGAQYSASPAGFLFEAFLAALAGGDSAQIPASQPGQEKTIADFTIKLPDSAGVPVSLKLLARKGGGVHGSVNDLLNAFAKQIPEAAELKKAWAGAPEETPPAEEPKLAAEGRGAQAATLWDDEQGKYVPREEPAPGKEGEATPSIVGDDIVGMKYIIVLKTAGSKGVKLDFYEFDFTWEKFKIFQQLGKVPKPGSGKTQFKLNKTDYITGPKGHAGMGSGQIVKSFTLPSSDIVRLKAQGILKELYNDFYEILKTLKEATDQLNVYLAEPEKKEAGTVAATEAGNLQTQITKTTEK